MIELLLDNNIETQGVEINEHSAFTPDITPIILAAHKDNYECINYITLRTIFIQVTTRGTPTTEQLARLKLAIKLRQKRFVAHPNCQQLLAGIWYEGLPGFRNRNIIYKCLLIFVVSLSFPILSVIYLLAPKSSIASFTRKPFVKFLSHSASYVFFLPLSIAAYMVKQIVDVCPQLTQRHKDERLCWAKIFMRCNWEKQQKNCAIILKRTVLLILLILASQRIDSVDNMFRRRGEPDRKEGRGPPPTPVEIAIGIWVLGNIFYNSYFVVVVFQCGMKNEENSNRLKHKILFLQECEQYKAWLAEPLFTTQQLTKEMESLRESCDSKYKSCSSIYHTSETLFWAMFGLVDLSHFSLKNQADIEWKFARSKLFIEYFDDTATLPPPFNIIPSPKSFYYGLKWLCDKLKIDALQFVTRNLVKRYIAQMQRVKQQSEGVSEDDVNEIKQDISAFRYELLGILRNAGFNTGHTDINQKTYSRNKKGVQWPNGD
uniref:ANK_REP_REGION domain-containing protein n=1 Tax=Heterorhabditis bacteriophora TaxID=37862 RepID=A0A1I7X9C8_HETBA